jgi:hypothetical protein
LRPFNLNAVWRVLGQRGYDGQPHRRRPVPLHRISLFWERFSSGAGPSRAHGASFPSSSLQVATEPILDHPMRRMQRPADTDQVIHSMHLLGTVKIRRVASLLLVDARWCGSRRWPSAGPVRRRSTDVITSTRVFAIVTTPRNSHVTPHTQAVGKAAFTGRILPGQRSRFVLFRSYGRSASQRRVSVTVFLSSRDGERTGNRLPDRNS